MLIKIIATDIFVFAFIISLFMALSEAQKREKTIAGIFLFGSAICTWPFFYSIRGVGLYSYIWRNKEPETMMNYAFGAIVCFVIGLCFLFYDNGKPKW